jgi:hypothetical protein
VHVREQITIERPAHTGAAITQAVNRLADASLELDAPSVPALLALLAAGRFDRVRPVIAAAGPLVAPTALAVVLGRYVAWTGDLHFAAALWQRMSGALDTIAPGGDDVATVVTAGALLNIERLASDVGDPRTAARAHAALRDAMLRLRQRIRESDAAYGGAALRLLAAAVGCDEPPGDTPAALGGSAPAADPRAGYAPAAAGDAAPFPDAVLDPAALVLETVHARLGLDADATRHRLRLRPVLPGTGAIVIRSIGIGDATISLEVEVAEDRIRIELEQDSGALPVTALLEPAVIGAVRSASVDGRPASLTPRPWADRLLVPVQLVLDARRTLVLELDARGGHSPE